MSSRQPILIASSSFDEHTHGPVCEVLLDKGWPIVVYLADRVVAGDDVFSLDIDGSAVLRVSYQGQDISPTSVSAAWLWKVANFRIPEAESNVSKQLTMLNELTQFNNSVWSLYPADMWLSSPGRIQIAERKLMQLIVARQVGFAIPRTHLGNQWADTERMFADAELGMIVKMFRGVIADQNQIKAMYTTRLDDVLLEDLRARTIPFPGIYQPYIPKAREWRVTMVGDEVFAGAVYTNDDAKDDWRRLQATAAVALRREPLASEAADHCRAYLKAMGLGIGSFDLVEQPNGEFVFLECNPSGQFGFLEEILGLPISVAIADRLIQIATSD